MNAQTNKKQAMAETSVSNDESSKRATAEEIAAHAFEALLTTQQMANAEEHFRSIGATRRMALALLTKPKEELASAFGKSEDTASMLMDEYDNLTGYIEHLESHKALMDCAHTRILCVLATIDGRPKIS